MAWKKVCTAFIIRHDRDVSIPRLILILLLAAAFHAKAEAFLAERSNDAKPVISLATFTDVDPAYVKQGSNINGPSVRLEFQCLVSGF